TDGTIEGTVVLKKFDASTVVGAQYLAPFTKEFIIVAFPGNQEHIEIFVSKGTPESTKLLSDLNPTSGQSSKPADFRELENGNIIFKAEQTEDDRELFLYDRFVPLSVSLKVENQISCHDSSDGALSVQAINGTPPYTYFWSTGDNTQTVSGLSAGNYMVTVTDQNNMSLTSARTLSAPQPIMVI